ncbi:MAG: Flp pilus assembly complex ATPase component TadA [Verrucomicrobia bacterium]|nr:Flp pilus assembly complex ATPase component TadA [Verrucomicrobiota bacterium]
MTAADERWKTVVEFVQANPVSDISLFGANITARLEGKIAHLTEPGALSREDVQELIEELIRRYPAANRQIRQAMGSSDFTAELMAARFRINLGYAQGELFASLRPLPKKVPDLEEVGIPSRIAALLANLTDGLVLVSGPTGSGKTTTIAAMIEAVNRQRQAKIVTIEDPVEFLFIPDQAEVIQREVGWDVPSYAEGLRQALRQNPDVIVVGEIRDGDSVLAALQAAETGHLVIGSVHASSVVDTVRRFILLAPQSLATEVRYVLGRTMRLMMNQRLLRRRTSGRAAVREICIHAANTEAVILSGNEQELQNYMLAGKDVGMVDFQSALRQVQSQLDPAEFRLYRQG